jgi:hypothetical protein
MRILLVVTALCFAAAPVSAGYAARESWVPVAGHATGFGSRHFETTVYMTDMSRSMNDVTVSFFPAGQQDAKPRSVTLQLGPNQTGALGVGAQLAGENGGIGALFIRSTGPLLTEAHVYTHLENAPVKSDIGEVLNAIPAQFAVGTGDSTLVHVPAGVRYKLYAVETNGFPLYFSVLGGSSGPERRLLIGAHEQRSWDLAQLFPAAEVPVLRITGVNGSGKIIVLGTAIAPQSEDFSAYEMLLPTRARHRMTGAEITAYAAVALAIVIAALYGRKKPAME